jgi:hypothetical protein
MTRYLLAIVMLVAATGVVRADPDPKRKVVVLEYRAGSSAIPGIARRIVDTLGKQTSLTLLGPEQTRAVYGDHLDQVVVKCAGEADCVAKIGQRVGAAEVILVGVSELGDVILTLQRIDVATRAVSGRVAESLAVTSKPTDAQIDGYLTRILPPSDFLRYGVIDIIASEAGAAVTVGGEQRGVTPIPPIKLHAPATYDIHVEKRGFIAFNTQVTVPPDGEVKVRATLQKPGATAWYAHWYVLAAASAVVVGAAGTTVYFATRSNGGIFGTPDTSLTLKGGVQ